MNTATKILMNNKSKKLNSKELKEVSRELTNLVILTENDDIVRRYFNDTNFTPFKNTMKNLKTGSFHWNSANTEKEINLVNFITLIESSITSLDTLLNL